MIILPMIFPGQDRIFNRELIDPQKATIRLRTNERSYIIPSFQYDDPDTTIAFLGGSTTECMAVEEELRFPALVSSNLAEHGIKANTLNAARAGNNMQDSLNVLMNHVVNDTPDFVVIMHATNDIAFLSKEGSYVKRMGRPLDMMHVLRWLKYWISQRSYFVGFARHQLAGPRITPNATVAMPNSKELPVEHYRQRLKAFVGIARAFGIQPLLMTQPLSALPNELRPDWADVASQDRFNNIIREVGEETGVPVIDLAQHLVQTISNWDELNFIFYDGMHVTDQGSMIYARYITERFLPLIQASLASTAEPAPPTLTPTRLSSR